MEIKVIELPYEKSVLQPFLSKETVEFHYEKHHKGYFKKLEKLITKEELETLTLEQIMSEKRSYKDIYNNAAQVWNHNFYWQCLTPDSPGEPVRELAKALQAGFGSIETFHKDFNEKAVKLFGSGWTWLVADKEKKLQIVNTKDGDNPLLEDLKPIMTCDVWEHAYYIDYRNKRDEYLAEYWKYIDWEFANKNFLDA